MRCHHPPSSRQTLGVISTYPSPSHPWHVRPKTHELAPSRVCPFALRLVTPHLASSGHCHPVRVLLPAAFSPVCSLHVTREGLPDHVTPLGKLLGDFHSI